MNAYRTLGILLSSSILVLAACGTSTLGGGSGADGTGATGTTTGGGGDTGFCGGKPNPAECAHTGCPSGYACVKDTDPTACHSSECSCMGDSWVCTADCELGGSSCVPDECNGVTSPASCTDTSCPSGFSCTPDPDPMSCHPSQCTCGAGGWTCSHDCATNGSICVKGL